MLRTGSVLLYSWCGGFSLQRDLPGARDTPFYVQPPLVYFLAFSKKLQEKKFYWKGPKSKQKVKCR